jgi:hypothetical protein
MLLIGGIFVFFSGLIYFIFLAAWLNFFLITSQIRIITIIAGIVALVIGFINVKDFFFFKKGVSLSISDSHRIKLIKKMHNLVHAASLPSMIIGTILLAITSNMYELLCTAGFPMVFTKILTEKGLSMFQYYAYLFLYCLVYIIPLLVIVLIFTFTFGSKRLSQSQGEALKLISGLMMLSLGALIVFKPELLTNVFAAVFLLLISIFLALLIIFARKRMKQESMQEKRD